MKIAGVEIGNGSRCYIVAEIGSNHDGELERALGLVGLAASCGADAVKFQGFGAEQLYNPIRFDPGHEGETFEQLENLKKLEVPVEWWEPLRRRCREEGVHFIVTVFDESQADALDKREVDAFKIASGDLTHYALLDHIGEKGRPVIVSTGASYTEEVDGAVLRLRAAGCKDFALLHCVANYPPHWDQVNLRCITTMKKNFNLPVGWSDHTPGFELAVGAVAMGASVVEKHITDDKARRGPDHSFAMVPEGFRTMVESIRHLEAALGDGMKRPAAEEVPERYWCRRGIWASCNITKGTLLTRDHIKVVRPCHGLAASDVNLVLGKRARRTIRANHPILSEDL